MEGLADLANSRLALPAQPVDATPSSRLIRPYIRQRTAAPGRAELEADRAMFTKATRLRARKSCRYVELCRPLAGNVAAVSAIPACSAIMDLSSHRFVLTWDHLVERRVRLDGRLRLPDVFAAGGLHRGSAVDARLICSANTMSQLPDCMKPQAAPASLIKRRGQHHDSDRNPSSGMATRFGLIMSMSQEMLCHERNR
jgi:hypothetical protein